MKIFDDGKIQIHIHSLLFYRSICERIPDKVEPTGKWKMNNSSILKIEYKASWTYKTFWEWITRKPGTDVYEYTKWINSEDIDVIDIDFKTFSCV